MLPNRVPVIRLITPLTRHADIHLRIRPGTSGALALAMAHVIIEEDLFDRKFVSRWAIGFDEYRNLTRDFGPDVAQKITGVPACTSYERSELKFYPEKKILWTRPAIEPLGKSRSDADIIFDLAKTLAPDDDLLREGYEASVDWILEPSGFKLADLKKYPRGLTVKDVSIPPYRKYEKAGFKTPSGKMEFTSLVLAEHGIDSLPVYREPELSPVSAPEKAKDFPLILTTGARLPFFIHSRMFRIPRLLRFQPDPGVDLNPVDARRRGLNQGDWVQLSTDRGAIRVRANLTETVMPGVVSMYHGRPEADVNSLIDPDYRDPISGFPAFKSLLCEVKKDPEKV